MKLDRAQHAAVMTSADSTVMVVDSSEKNLGTILFCALIRYMCVQKITRVA